MRYNQRYWSLCFPNGNSINNGIKIVMKVELKIKKLFIY